jgi:hypothetical protein
MKTQCDNCGFVCDESELIVTLEDIPHLDDRLDAGGEVPAGECNKCGCLVYLMENQQ